MEANVLVIERCVSEFASARKHQMTSDPTVSFKTQKFPALLQGFLLHAVDP